MRAGASSAAPRTPGGRPSRSARAADSQFDGEFQPACRIPTGSSSPDPIPVSMDTSGIALSGMRSAQTRVAVSAHDVANLLTENFRPQRAVQTSVASGGAEAMVATSPMPEPVSLEREVVDQIVAKTQFKASARVLDVDFEMRGSLLDMLA